MSYRYKYEYDEDQTRRKQNEHNHRKNKEEKNISLNSICERLSRLETQFARLEPKVRDLDLPSVEVNESVSYSSSIIAEAEPSSVDDYRQKEEQPEGRLKFSVDVKMVKKEEYEEKGHEHSSSDEEVQNEVRNRVTTVMQNFGDIKEKRKNHRERRNVATQHFGDKRSDKKNTKSTQLQLDPEDFTRRRGKRNNNPARVMSPSNARRYVRRYSEKYIPSIERENLLKRPCSKRTNEKLEVKEKKIANHKMIRRVIPFPKFSSGLNLGELTKVLNTSIASHVPPDDSLKRLTEMEVQILVRDVEEVSSEIQKYITKWKAIQKAKVFMEEDDEIKRTVLSACVLLDTKLKRAKELLNKYNELTTNMGPDVAPNSEMKDAMLYYQLTQLDVASVTRMFIRLDGMLTLK